MYIREWECPGKALHPFHARYPAAETSSCWSWVTLPQFRYRKYSILYAETVIFIRSGPYGGAKGQLALVHIDPTLYPIKSDRYASEWICTTALSIRVLQLYVTNCALKID